MPSKHTKIVVLTDYQVGFLERLVKSGRYQNASEVVRDGLRALEVRVERDEAELAVHSTSWIVASLWMAPSERSSSKRLLTLSGVGEHEGCHHLAGGGRR